MNLSSISLNSSQTNFNSQFTNKSDMLATVMQVMKSDILQLHEKTIESSHIISMIGKTGSSIVKKKIQELEDLKKEGIKTTLDRLTEEANDADKLGKFYKTTKKTELISKLSIDQLYNDLLIKKLSEYI